MGWLANLSLSRQAKDCLTVIGTFDVDFEEEAAWSLLKPDVANAIRQNEKIVRQKILHDGILPRDVVLTLAANLSLQSLESGKHHIYRGVLSMTGSSYRTIFSTIVNAQASIGSITQDERDQALLNMADAIAGAG